MKPIGNLPFATVVVLDDDDKCKSQLVHTTHVGDMIMGYATSVLNSLAANPAMAKVAPEAMAARAVDVAVAFCTLCEQRGHMMRGATLTELVDVPANTPGFTGRG